MPLAIPNSDENCYVLPNLPPQGIKIWAERLKHERLAATAHSMEDVTDTMLEKYEQSIETETDLKGCVSVLFDFFPKRYLSAKLSTGLVSHQSYKLDIDPVLYKLHEGIELISDTDLPLWLKINLVKDFYSCTNPEKVEAFLLSHDYLINALLETRDAIKKYFWQHLVDFYTDFHQDPEEDYQGLTIYLQTDLSPKEAIELLDIFDDEWWLDIDERVSELVTIISRPE